ncbi:MAG: GtrA family protein [Paludibacteraceae bacterium]
MRVEKLFTFAKAQVSAFVGGIVDYGIMVFLTEVFHIHYTVSIAIGGIVGALINFLLNKKWTFYSKNYEYKHSFHIQLTRFALVVVNSIVLKSSGTFLITHFLHFNYKISRIIADLIVSIAFNYVLQRLWVFKKQSKIA